MVQKNFIQWMGDNEYEVNEFVGQQLEWGQSPDDLMVPTKDGRKVCELGNYIVKGEDGQFEVFEEEEQFKRRFN